MDDMGCMPGIVIENMNISHPRGKSGLKNVCPKVSSHIRCEITDEREDPYFSTFD